MIALASGLLGTGVLGSEILATENPAADFSQDNGWVVFGKALGVFVFLVLLTLFTIWFERRVVSWMQSRIGPNRTGPQGLLQSLADGMKLMFKEDIIPAGVDRVVFIVAPLISAFTCFLAFSVIPLGPEARIPFTDIVTPLQLTDLPVAVLFVLAIAAVGVYGIVLAGWSSGSTYPLLGGLRSSAQVISYEIAMGLALISVFLYAGSMSTSQIVAAQADAKTASLFGLDVPIPSWYFVQLLPAFIIYVISMVGETNRAPFDLPEAEGELVGGFHTEYSAMKFAMFFLAEYINLITVSAIATTLFLGGWRAPWPISAINDGMFNQGWWPILWFTAKVLGFIFLFIWLRGTLPRLRYDQFMRFGWKVLIPLSLVWIVFVSIIRAIGNSGGDMAAGVQLALIATLIVVLAGLFWGYSRWADAADQREQARHQSDYPSEVDPFAGGFPVPPLPGQRVLRTSGPAPAENLVGVGTITYEATSGSRTRSVAGGSDDDGPEGTDD